MKARGRLPLTGDAGDDHLIGHVEIYDQIQRPVLGYQPQTRPESASSTHLSRQDRVKKLALMQCSGKPINDPALSDQPDVPV